MPGIASTSDIVRAYEDVRNDKTDTDFLFLTYESDTSDKLVMNNSGQGGLPELQDLFKDDSVAYAYLRFKVGNDQLSKRTKFILITWIGANVKVMRKAKVSVHLSEVKQTLAQFAIEIQASNLSDLKEDTIVLKLKKAMGANYDRQNSEY